MPIPNVNVGDPITEDLMNAIIDAINSVDISWVNFQGDGSVVIREFAGNIASVNHFGLGQYRITFSTPRSNANYAVVGNCTVGLGNDTGFIMLLTLTTTYVDIQVRNDDGGFNQASTVTVIIVGN